MYTVRHCQVPGKPRYTSASTWRTLLVSGPPRARIARSSSGRGAHPIACSARTRAANRRLAAAPLRDLSTLGGRVVRGGRSLAIPCALGLSACALFHAHGARSTAPVGPAYDERDATLANGRLALQVKIPHAPRGPKPAVIAPSGQHRALLEAGLVVVTYRFNWTPVTPAKEQLPTPGPRPYGEWMLASPTRELVGAGFFDLIGANANRIPEVIDYLSRLPEVDPERIAITGVSTAGFSALEATARDSRLSVAAVVAACGDYLTFLRLSAIGMKGEPLALDPAYARDLETREAVRHPGHLTHAALL